MAEDVNLEQFKQDIIKRMVDTNLDILLDLRNAINRATSSQDIEKLLLNERERMRKFFGFTEDKKEGTERNKSYEYHPPPDVEDDPPPPSPPAKK